MYRFRYFLSPLAALLVLLLLAGMAVVVKNSPFSHSNSTAFASPPPVIQPLPHRTQLYSSDYVYFTDQETTRFGEYIWYFAGDTLRGAVRTNHDLYIHPVAYFGSRVIVGGHIFSRAGSTFGGFVVENAPQAPFPTQATSLRNAAATNGTWFDSENNTYTYGMWFHGTSATYWRWQTGTPSPFPNISQATGGIDWNNTAPFAIFCNGDLWIYGDVHGTVGIGASGNLRLMDNIVYTEAQSFPYTISLSMTDMMTLVSEAAMPSSTQAPPTGIIIANTTANGRNGGEYRYPRGNFYIGFRDIAIHGHLMALNSSFTFEEQNDTWEPFHAPDSLTSDERGQIFLTGSVTQKIHGYVHRSNHGGTGYLRDYVQDPRCNPAADAEPVVAPFAFPVAPETYSLPGRP